METETLELGLEVWVEVLHEIKRKASEQEAEQLLSPGIWKVGGFREGAEARVFPVEIVASPLPSLLQLLQPLGGSPLGHRASLEVALLTPSAYLPGVPPQRERQVLHLALLTVLP